MLIKMDRNTEKVVPPQSTQRNLNGELSGAIHRTLNGSLNGKLNGTLNGTLHRALTRDLSNVPVRWNRYEASMRIQK